MKFVVQSKTLQTQLQAVSKVMNTKNAMTILDNFLFIIEGNTLTIVGSDQENVLKATMDIEDSDGDGRIALNAKRLLDLLKEVPEQGLTFLVDDDTLALEIQFLSGHLNMMAVDANEYPEGDALTGGETRLMIPAAVVQKGIEATIFAVSTETLRPVMMGIYWDIHNDDITFVSSDTHKLVRYVNSEVQPGMERSFIIPAKPAGILRSVISGEDTEVEVLIGEKNATFTVGRYSLTCRFIKGNYPDYTRVIPKDNPYEVQVDRAGFLRAVRCIAVSASQASGLIKFDITEDHIHLSASDADYALSAEENVPCTYNGSPMTIGFKAQFMVEVLSNLKGETVLLKLCDPSRPGIFTPEEKQPDEDQLTLLMPMQTFDY